MLSATKVEHFIAHHHTHNKLF